MSLEAPEDNDEFESTLERETRLVAEAGEHIGLDLAIEREFQLADAVLGTELSTGNRRARSAATE